MDIENFVWGKPRKEVFDRNLSKSEAKSLVNRIHFGSPRVVRNSSGKYDVVV